MLALREEMLKNCKICNGTGIVNIKDECECVRKYEYYVGLAYSGIDREYWDLSLDDWNGDELAKDLVVAYIKNIDVAFKEGLGIVFFGSNGVGKTFAATQILKEAQKKGHSIYKITLAELLERIKSSFESNKEEFDEFYQENILDISFLVLDNLSSEYSPKNNKTFPIARLDLLFRHRRGNCLPTIITTNFEKNEFIDNYGTSVNSLLSSRSKFIQVTGDDYRKNQQSDWDKFIIIKKEK
jgi:DNA replication protein DnaC